ncbi:MAG TPA: hypothetical protein P5307_29540 [Pirellulaceae bacterium]|nr:hypothetical protein [Planctomycetales bacterium]HRX83259.1 hypothetical protein [Pirellulaceae bacterium]
MEYVNRRGHRYFVFQGKTKSGKPKYFASRKQKSDKAELIESLPESYELFENPADGLVHIRLRRTSPIIEAERELVERLVLALSSYSIVQTIIDRNFIVVYVPDTDPMDAAARMVAIFGTTPAKIAEWTASQTRYSAELRFGLVDADERLFVAERFCYRSSVDDWIPISGTSSLEPLVRQIAVRLGSDSFYDFF